MRNLAFVLGSLLLVAGCVGNEFKKSSLYKACQFVGLVSMILAYAV